MFDACCLLRVFDVCDSSFVVRSACLLCVCLFRVSNCRMCLFGASMLLLCDVLYCLLCDGACCVLFDGSCLVNVVVRRVLFCWVLSFVVIGVCCLLCVIDYCATLLACRIV